MMKLFGSLLGLILLMAACATEVSIDQSSAETVAKGFMEALQEQEFETAQKYCTSSAREALIDFETNLKMSNEEEKATQLAAFAMEIRTVECLDKDGSTVCTICCNTTEEAAELGLVKQDDKWYVSTEIGI
jgi:hypothetical protein